MHVGTLAYMTAQINKYKYKYSAKIHRQQSIFRVYMIREESQESRPAIIGHVGTKNLPAFSNF